jgi:hypothetical protein
MKALLCVPVFLLAAGCSGEKEPPAGGGEHRIMAVAIVAKEGGTLRKENNPATLRVGERLHLAVRAAWAIPSVVDVTDKAALSLSDAGIAGLDAHGVLTGKKSGRVVVTAVLRVSRGTSDAPLGASDPPGKDPVVTLKDTMDLDVIP